MCHIFASDVCQVAPLVILVFGDFATLVLTVYFMSDAAPVLDLLLLIIPVALVPSSRPGASPTLPVLLHCTVLLIGSILRTVIDLGSHYWIARLVWTSSTLLATLLTMIGLYRDWNRPPVIPVGGDETDTEEEDDDAVVVEQESSVMLAAVPSSVVV
jgi:hypothetical protein